MSDKAAKEKLIKEIMKETGYSRAEARFVAAIELGAIDGDSTAVEADGITRARRQPKSEKPGSALPS